MNQKHDREATIDRLLAGPATRGSADSTAACLDADTLAAWADGALDAAALATAEAHAADCARCQAMLSAMARTAPAGATAAATSWWMPSLRWLVPLTAAAAAVLVWTIVPGRDVAVNVRLTPRSSATPSATDAAAPSSTLAAGSTARREEQTPAERKDVGGANADLSRSKADPSRRSAEGAKAEGAKADPSRRSANGAKAEADKKDTALADTSALADARSRNANLSRRSSDGARADLSHRSAEGAKADPSRRSANGAKAESAAAAPAAPPPPMAKTFSFGAPETVIVSSSNPASRWRILQGGAVQRSSDGGATWQTQNTGVSETLSSGSSPSPSVCWLVGPQGIVLRTTDGRSWTRIPFPEAVPLASVRATDDQTATVTTADGRQFVTGDGGRTWTRAPGV